MPKLKTQLPKYRRKSDGRASVVLDGREITLGRYGTPESQEQYNRVLAGWLANGRKLPEEQNSPYASAHEPLVGDVMLAYLKYADQTYRHPDQRHTSQFDAIKQALLPLQELYAHEPAIEFGPRKLKLVREAMKERGWARTTINFRVDKVKRMFRWAVGEEMVPPSVYDALKAVSGLAKGRDPDVRETEPVRPVPEETVKKVLPLLSPPVAAMVQLQWLTGMRPGEVVAMTRGQINFAGRNRNWEYMPEHHKTAYRGQGRTIYIGPKGQELLAAFVDRATDKPLFSPAEAEEHRHREEAQARKTSLSCGNRRGSSASKRGGSARRRPPGDQYTVSSYGTAVARACDRAFPPPPDLLPSQAGCNEGERSAREKRLREWRSKHRFRPNQLRHAAAKRIREANGLEAVQAMLGHASFRMSEHYAGVSERAAAEVAAASG